MLIIRFIVGLLVMVLLLQSCAEQRPLTGGPKDTQGPMIAVDKYSTPNYQTNFKEEEIILTFNEWVVLKNAYSKVLISPPLKEKPDIRVRHKSVVLKFKEPLREQTTYTVQYGDAVVDYTEGNPSENLRFVFSTGDYIDSLSLEGQIVDAETGAAREKVWVMLYDNLADSVPKTERPFYLAKTNKQGQFKLENLRADSFRIFALDDQNANYKFDQPTEAIAFWPEVIALSDSTEGRFKLRMFTERQPLQLSMQKLVDKGFLEFKFNQKVASRVQVNLLSQKTAAYQDWYEADGELIRFWWKGAEADSLLFEFVFEQERDSVWVDVDAGLDWPKPALGIAREATAGRGSKKPSAKPQEDFIHPKELLKLEFNHPIESWDLDKIGFFADTNQVKENIRVTKDSTNPRFLLVAFAKLEAKKYRLELLPEAIRTVWGTTNADTLKKAYSLIPEKDLGNIVLKVVAADSTQQYIVQLLDKEEKIIASELLINRDSAQYSYPDLKAQQYTALIIHDTDRNGRWSSGDYLKKRQAELKTRSKPIALRPGWDNEMVVDLMPAAQRKEQSPAADDSGKLPSIRGGKGRSGQR